jgi:hypothetical protein
MRHSHLTSDFMIGALQKLATAMATFRVLAKGALDADAALASVVGSRRRPGR